MRITRTAVALAAVTTALATAAVATGPAHAAPATRPSADPNCRLDPAHGQVKHVIYLQFDNVHFTRDNPNVPSDLEQMPHLLSFLTNNGTLDVSHHTPLIAHTGNDILTSITGVYGDRHGQPVANSYRYFTSSGTPNTGVTFAYWTDGIFDPSTTNPTDTTPTMVTPQGKVAPAPWVAYTRAGCDFGSVSTANTILENTGPDVPKVFGAGSPEAAEAQANPALAQTDFVGIGVHCAQASALCAKGSARPDVLPDEPGGYQGYQGLFGAKYVDPAISASGKVSNVDGSATITDPAGNPGFPGFDGMSAANTLGYVAQMQEAGVPVTYGYISDAHDKHPSGPAYGPGEAGYVAALKSYDSAFASFFDRLSRDGINKNNTMFVVTADENDHFVGGPPSPANCDGVTVPCAYSTIGEINANMRGLLATQQGVTTPFAVHADSAPTVYLNGQPSRTDATVRSFERATGKLTTTNPISGVQNQRMVDYLADPVEEKLLHMVTGDPLRTPTFTAFANPDYFLFTGAANCTSPCVTVQPGFAWNHGDFAPDINQTWLGMVGPGVRRLGVTRAVWSDQTDVRPTMLSLLGLRDDYRSDGRLLFEFVDDAHLPAGLRGHRAELVALGQVYKQLNACVGEFGTDTLVASTRAIQSDTPGDAQYNKTMNALTRLGELRDAVAADIAAQFDNATFHNGRLDEWRARWDTRLAQGIIQDAKHLAS
ncbi:MAG TPA: hypothetical protein VJT31_38265 [Rugosimonospora sp.]|nr:hypothetical protein [Rugosimonospora sp.]